MWFKQGQIEVDSGDGDDCDGDECGDACGDANAKKIFPTPFLSLPLHPINNTPNNQSKPIVSTLSFSLITSRYNFSL